MTDFSWIDEKLTIDGALAERILSNFVRNEIQRHGFEKAVVGLSGGIDSSVSCFLAAAGLGPENVLAVRMPYRTSSEASMEDAAEVIEQLGVHELTVDITDMVDPLFEKFPDMDNVRRGNVMARERMIILYDQSVAFEGLVLGTGNKTELLLGYSTLYGDSASALNPNGDLYKTQLRQLARHLGVPEKIIEKPPSADLWAGQTDEGELGFTYKRVDRLLYLMVDERYSLEECVEAGFEAAFVNQVADRVKRMQFKRVMPLIAKISDRTIGYDFLYPRDWGT
ncbi:MAG: NAD+ synthase [Anaerolineales bacterium]